MNRNSLMAGVVVVSLLCGGLAQANVGPDEVIRQASIRCWTWSTRERDELKADPDELYRVVDDILLPRFDRRYTGGLVMGKYWRKATPNSGTALSSRCTVRWSRPTPAASSNTAATSCRSCR